MQSQQTPQPATFRGEDDKVVLIHRGYVVGALTRAQADQCVARIDQGTMERGDLEEFVPLAQTFEYEFEENDVAIMFGVKDPDSRYVNVTFVDKAELQVAEKVLVATLPSFRRSQQRLSALQASLMPLLFIAVAGCIGGFLSWWAYQIDIGAWPTRDTVVKMWVKLAYELFRLVGYVPMLVLTCLVVAPLAIWLVKRLANPPMQTTARKV